MRNHLVLRPLFAVALTLSTLAVLPLPAAAGESGLTVQQAWSRPAPAGHTGVLYLTVTDTGSPDQLIGVSTPVAATAELHQSMMTKGNVMEMRPVAALPVSSDKKLALSPGGYHIMLMNLKRPLKEGDTVPFTLTFRNAGTVAATATVQREAPHG